MSLKQKIQEDLNRALKKRESVRVGTLRLLLAAMVNKEKESIRQVQEKDKELSDEEIQGVLITEAKKRREAKEAFEKGGRQELADKEKAELEVLLKYLPEQLTEDEIRQLVKEAILSLREISRREKKTEDISIKDMGKVMAELAPLVKGKADGAIVSNMVKEFLAQ